MSVYILIALVLTIVGAVLIKTKVSPLAGKIMILIASAEVVVSLCLLAVLIMVFGSVNSSELSVLVCVIGVVCILVIAGILWGFIKKKWFYIPAIVISMTCIISIVGVLAHQAYIDSIPTVGENSTILYDYSPFIKDSIIAELDEESTLKINENFPVIDGATALYPVYAAFAKAVYPDELFENDEDWMKYDNEYLYCSTTTHAYERIVTGEADIIFVAAPNENQMKVAQECGVELVFTPVGREAFVFFVNKKNPLDNITLSDVQKIYSGEITNWKELGVKNLGKIRAFQRDEGSGSQSALERLMKGKKLMEAPKEDIIGGMGGIISRTADYRNYKNAIGYSFRFYSTQMVKNDMIKLLSIDAVAPTVENIENGSYPIASQFFAVTRADADENTLKLLEWVQGEQGQRIVEMTGYTPIKKGE